MKKKQKKFKKSVDFGVYVVYNHSCVEALPKRKKQNIGKELTGCGSAWLERLIWDQEVAGSNPVTPTYFLKNIL